MQHQVFADRLGLLRQMQIINHTLKRSPLIRDKILQTQTCRLASGTRSTSSFIPQYRNPDLSDVIKLQEFVDNARRLVVLTGAGLSTESGIPDYRSEGVGLYARTTRRPMQYQQFIQSESARQRYWARNFVGWPKFSASMPNSSHYTLCEWERKGKVLCIVTQNVDALHTKAGSKDVIELHGCSHRVRCLTCKSMLDRHDLQIRFEEENSTWNLVDMPVAPDGDVLMEEEQVKSFKVSPCKQCGGALIPDVTFFGDNVSRTTVETVYKMVDKADAMLVCGSSLQVWSGYRFVVRAAGGKIPVALVNVGPTRADKLASLKIDTLCGSILPQIRVATVEQS